MADFEKDDLDGMEEDAIVVITDEEGNEFYYREEMVIPVGDKNFAILVPLEMDEEEGCECSEEESDCDCCGGEQDAIIARIDEDEKGEQVYVDPTDEEYEAVIKAYDEIMAEEEAED
ncbi:hypothetical protein AXX12_05385 [Anaerosporomusa subterranea]|jgi:uncharacterized protein YrzB (UPF0473 family)|uniref:Uncharacterized protein n=1 Tax=Anaerosporomusa subterranea TaxID=1794912 RepID=A0A154BUR0_ANASB|nr:DUF1292 domain-containing protein [Anaerosporomusa subterranea]KYZ77540.1 hypothetical protein AXX12_05385 [Anaerosporomusa subterranea]